MPLAVATAAAIGTAARIQGVPRWWASACSMALAVVVLFAVPAQLSLWRIQHDWPAWRQAGTERGLSALRRSLDDAVAAARSDAADALNAPPDRTQAFDALAAVVRHHPERGLVVYRGDTAVAWAGAIRAPVDLRLDGPAIVATSFYLTLQVVERRVDSGGLVRAAAVRLLAAEPPADRLASALARSIASDVGLAGFKFGPPRDSAPGPDVLRYAVGGVRLFDVRARPLAQGEVTERVLERVRARDGLAFILALACFIIGVWRGTRKLPRRVAALAVGLACIGLIPLSQYSNSTRLFDPSIYFTPGGGALTGNAGALAATGAMVLLGVLAVFRRQAHRASRWGAIATIVVVAGLGPFLLRELARGVQTPLHGVDGSLWLIWEIPLFLAAVSVLLAGAAAGAIALGVHRGLSPWVAPAVATLAATLAPVVWDAPGRWPWWYALLWVLAIGMLALSRRTRFVILSAATVAALGAVTLVWARTARGRVDAAIRDLDALSQVDAVAVTLLRRFGDSLSVSYAPLSRQALLMQFVASDVSSAGNPVALSAWPTDSFPTAHFETARIPLDTAALRRLVARARRTGLVTIEPVPTDTATEVVMAAPAVSGGVTAVVLAPKSRMFAPGPYARLLGLDVDPEAEPPYTVRLHARMRTDSADDRMSWRRDGSQLHGDWSARTGSGVSAAHVEVDLRPLDALVERGALIVLLDLALVGLLWMTSVIADGGAARWLRARRRTWGRSYRARLSVALFAFFVIPALAFAVWSYQQLLADAAQSRSVLVSETLRALQPAADVLRWLPEEAGRLDAPLFLYEGGELRGTSDPLYDDLAPIGRYLPPETELTLAVRGEETDTRVERVDASPALFGYRSFRSGGAAATMRVIAAPARADELASGRRRRDLGILVLFATAIGALAALWLSGIAARQLARPIGALREAALSIASGASSLPIATEPTVEFSPVFSAFRRMAADLNASRTALEDAQRRTAAVLRNVGSGVIALDADGRVSLANPRAEALFGCPLPPGTRFDSCAPAALVTAVSRFLRSDAEEEMIEVSLEQQQLRGTLTRLDRGGAVVTADDVTELARAQRVLAWGEMARQVAHEIKNPLTPIRLGVQHLRRARADVRVDFDRVLEQNVNQILIEIDRLDEIARAFSRYGAAPEERAEATSVDVAAVVRDVVALERMGDERGLAWLEQGVDAPIHAFARGEELREVLLNLLENARHAGAQRVTVSVAPVERAAVSPPRVTIQVSDDGHGIPADVLPRIFEPHFSTRTSGSGLGLAISRRLIESWGGEVTVDSAAGEGTTVTISLRT